EPYINEAKTGYAGGDKGLSTFIDKFFRHNWKNDKLVPIRNGKIRSDGSLITKYDTNKPYIKTVIEGFNGNDITVSYRLWKNAGYTLENGVIKSSIFIPVSKLGFNEEGNNIYEYTNDVKIEGLS